MSSADRFLRAVRSRPAASERATDVYITVLFVLIFVLPLARWATQQLAPTARWAVPAWAAIAAGVLLTLALALAGRTRGPVAVSAPYVDWVVVGPERLDRLLRPVWWRALVATTAAVVFAAAVAVVSRSSWPEPASAVVVAAVALVAGAVAALAWLAGQARRWSIVALAATASGLVAGALWAAWRSLDDDTAWWPLVVLVVAVAVVPLAPRCLAALRPSRLRAQAVRWSRVETFAVTADLASAAAVLRAPTRLGRRWRPSFGAPSLVRRDLLGCVRAPGRTAAGAALGIASGLVVGPAQDAVTPLVGAIAVTLAYAAVCFLSDGLRFHATDRERPSPFGLAPAAVARQHLVVPTLTLSLLMGLAAVPGGTPQVAVALALLAVACRALSVFKGHLPLELLTPVMTPVGEVSSAGRALWVADAFLVCLVVGAATISQASSWDAMAILLVAAAVVAMWARSRWSS